MNFRASYELLCLVVASLCSYYCRFALVESNKVVSSILGFLDPDIFEVELYLSEISCHRFLSFALKSLVFGRFH